MAGRLKSNSEEDLIRKLREGGEQAFTEIFNEWYAPLVLNAYRITDNQSASEDIAEDAFIKLWEMRDSYSEIHSLKSYLYTMTRNASLNWLEKSKREKQRYNKLAVTEEDAAPGMLENMIFDELMAGIYSVLEKLPGQCRKVFIMHYVEGKEIREIARELNITTGTVNTHKFRGIHLLQKALLGCFIWLLFCNY
ncbi:MAG TPA: RNA polymerase sigma-70 factor [Puia sp.]|jgi:RNA polymerase sigma-70 factor (family 1)|nr:RNA polymerase sigma-70 factor [Puia sp.]